MLDAPLILSRLAEANVEFVVVGGLAMVSHGSAHVTDDLDLCYHRTPENLWSLVTALAPLHPVLRGAPVDLPFRFDVPTIQAGLNFTLTTDLGPLDLLGEITGLGGFDQVAAQAEWQSIYGLAVRVLSLEGLIAAKSAAGRVKDRLHLLELVELKRLRDEPRETSGE